MEIEYKAVYKSDAERVSELLRNAGYQVEQKNILGLDISDGKYTIGAILEPDPDHDNGTQFFVSSNNEYDDGYLVLFQEGYPEDEQYEICHAVKWAFRAILDDRKTVTRRPIKPQPKFKLAYTFAGEGRGVKIGKWHYPDKNAYKYWGDTYKLPENITDEDKRMFWKAPYRGDDILYVRETWLKCEGEYWYKASHPDINYHIWRPSIHMPKESARIFLRVTDVRAEQLKDITDEQALKEGFSSRAEFISAFLKMYPKCTEDSWVWVIEFEKVEVSE